MFAVTAAHEWMCGDLPNLSIEFALWRAKARDADPGEATYPWVVLDAIHEDGQILDEAWPYDTPAYPADPPPRALTAARRMSGDWRRLTTPSTEVIHEALAADEAVILEIWFVPEAWQRGAFGGLIDAFATELTLGAHAVLVVGIEPHHPGGTTIVIKNSWGERWGDGGYGYLTARYLNAFGRTAYALAQRQAA